MLMMTAGANIGFRASLPLLAGVTLGKMLIHICLALGLWQIIVKFPFVLLLMKIMGAMYILWLAYKTTQLKIKKQKTAAGFVHGLFVHPLNPKAWAMVVSAYGQFIVADGDWGNWLKQTCLIALVFLFWQCIAHTFWCWGGERVAIALSGTRMEKRLMTILSALMVIAVLWALLN